MKHNGVLFLVSSQKGLQDVKGINDAAYRVNVQ